MSLSSIVGAAAEEEEGAVAEAVVGQGEVEEEGAEAVVTSQSGESVVIHYSV